MAVTSQELEVLSTKAIAAKATAYCMLPQNQKSKEPNPTDLI